MNVTIIGGGFGLYGYVPALIKCKNFKVFLPTRYQEKFSLRKDLACFNHLVYWINNDEDLLKICQGVIIALPPKEQYLWIIKCLYYKHITHMLLEKPLSINPVLSTKIINELIYSKVKFRIAYNFRFTKWGESIRFSQSGLKNFTWNFQAHHYKFNMKNWKRYHALGGGALRFYGIHFIAFLSELGYTDVCFSELKSSKKYEAESWHSQLKGDGLLTCTVNICSNSKETNFVIQDKNELNHFQLHPFENTLQQNGKNCDERIPYLMESLFDLFHRDQEQLYLEWYKHTNVLWYNIEQWTK